MARTDWGNKPVKSTGASTTADPSTSSLLAQVDSTQLAILTGCPTDTGGHGVMARVDWFVGATTNASFALEHCLSTGLGSTAIRDKTVVYMGSNLSGQYCDDYQILPGDRFRVRVNGSTFTGEASVRISVKPQT
jgi:hypothetical protein